MEEHELLELAKQMAYQGKSYEEIMKAVQRSTMDSTWGTWAIIAGYQKYKQPIENFIPRRIRIRRD